MEQEPQNEDVYLMPSTPHVTIQSPPPPEVNPSPSEEGDHVPLDDDPVMYVHNMSFDEFQKRIVQSWRNHFPDDHAATAFVGERVIVVDTMNNPNVIIEANVAFAGASRSNIHYLMIENEKLAQNLQALLGPHNTSVFPYYYCHYSSLLLLLCPFCPHIVIIVPRRSPLLLLLCPYIIIVMSAPIIL